MGFEGRNGRKAGRQAGYFEEISVSLDLTVFYMLHDAPFPTQSLLYSLFLVVAQVYSTILISFRPGMAYNNHIGGALLN